MTYEFFIVTNGSEFAYWGRGLWDTRCEFRGDCLLCKYNAEDAVRIFNQRNHYDDPPEWEMRRAIITIEESNNATKS